MLHQLLDGAFTLSILLVLGLLLSVKQWPEWIRRMRSAGWPTVAATIESGEVSTFRSRGRYLDRGIETATVSLGYSYQLDGNYFSGYHVETFNDEQKAWSYLDALKGKTVQISYNPRKPEISVLRPQTTL